MLCSQAELERLRKKKQQQNAELDWLRKRKQQEAASRAATAGAAAGTANGAGPAEPAVDASAAPGGFSAETMAQLQRTLVVKWSRADGDYSVARLREIFSANGQVCLAL